MPRSSSIHEKKIPTLPVRITNNRNLAVTPVQRPSFLQTMTEGVALGVGTSIGHRIAGALMGLTQVHTPVQHTDTKQKDYDQCMKEYYDDKAVCRHYLEN